MIRKLLEQAYAGATVVVTGSTGFKGSWLSLFLHTLGARVKGYGLEPAHQQGIFSVCRVGSLIHQNIGDIRDFSAVSDFVRNAAPRYVFHLAAQPLVRRSYREPRETFETNVQGTVNLLEALRGVESAKAIVVVTSDKCYENREWVHGYRETDRLGGKDPYSASKAAAELVAASYRSSYSENGELAPIATARAGNVIGGGDWSEDRIVPDCMRALMAGKPIVVRNPDAVRPWQHVLEPLLGYLILGARLGTDGAGFSGSWNFGPYRNDFVQVRVLVDLLVKRWGAGSVRVQRSPGKKREAGLLGLDISKSTGLLHWRPVLDFAAAVSQTVDEYRSVWRHPERAQERMRARIESFLAAAAEQQPEEGTA